ncbi:N-acetyltransferase [Permianibacter sp. IMCC34836]|uniref:GNAT family N-acetyltransferase n=1 Tax=Permianibacter fluminis TaxID=2738515 RepID=UPI001554FE71|nr:GNAT family N-acetyltransferase [Permianibacter fluminis]NQD38361.1 N-acetyltransferase [Permianibacter fluminis]
MHQSKISIRVLKEFDKDCVLTIFAEGIATGIATFETECPDWAGFNQRFLPAPRLVAERAGQVVGWAVLSAISARACYRGAAELSVYVASAAQGQGVGQQLLSALVTASEAAGFWTLQGTINRRNTASIALHARCGFREVGYRERIAQRDGVWQDTVLMERRSTLIGRD